VSQVLLLSGASPPEGEKGQTGPVHPIVSSAPVGKRAGNTQVAGVDVPVVSRGSTVRKKKRGAGKGFC